MKLIPAMLVLLVAAAFKDAGRNDTRSGAAGTLTPPERTTAEHTSSADTSHEINHDTDTIK